MCLALVTLWRVSGSWDECARMPPVTRRLFSVRASVPVFHPQSPALAALAQRVKESFDPKGLFNPGRMG